MKTSGQLPSEISMFRFFRGSFFTCGVIMLLAGSLGLLSCKGSSNEADSSSASSSPSASATGNRQEKFVLFIFNDNETGVDQSAEYQAWLKTIDTKHKAEWINLSDNGWILTPGQGGAVVEPRSEFPGSGDVGSYLVFEARNADEALNIAKTCPRLNSKSTVELRQIH